MKDLVWGELPARFPAPPDLPLAQFEALQRSAGRTSTFAWGEHCSECSFPSCQFTCAFYTPRADLTCQRFEHGIQQVAGTTAQIYRIVFRQWGKLEARGPVNLQSRRHRQVLNAADSAFARGLDRGPGSFRLKRFVAHQWNTFKPRISGKLPKAGASDFVIEAWSPASDNIDFTLTFLALADERLFQTRFTVSRDYMCHRVPVAEIAAAVDLTSPYLVQIEPAGDAQGKQAYFGIMDFVESPAEITPSVAAPPAGVPAPKAKVVVWDLDDTIWAGTLVEDGIAGLRLHEEMVAIIVELDRRGILHAISSKNDEQLAREALAHFGIIDFFVDIQIGWNPKSDGLRQIAAALDLHLDSFVFVDDQPFERAEVAAALPMVRVLSDSDASGLAIADFCEMPVTPESAARRSLYRAEHQRKVAFTTTRTDYLSFLRASEIRLQLTKFDKANAVRVHELSQRTNQLNFCGTRWSRDEAQSIAQEPGRWNLVLRCSDRYGDYGTIGFASLNPITMTLTDFFMSCRVQRKRVEHAFFQYLLRHACEAGHDSLTVMTRMTQRNQASMDLLQSLDFVKLAGDQDGIVLWSHPAELPVSESRIVNVEDRTGQMFPHA